MAIETICQGCARKLRVDDQYAGRQARCPHCKKVYTVPGTVQEEQPADLETWSVRTEDGSHYGPAARSELEQWVSEGRITAGTELRNSSGGDWQPAAAIFPELDDDAQPVNPFGEGTGEATNPYAASPTPATGLGAPVAHRGGAILTLGLLGVICCQILAPIAWALGNADLKSMEAGRMDPAGRGTTQAGMVLGIVGTVLMILGFGLQILMVTLGVAFDL